MTDMSLGPEAIRQRRKHGQAIIDTLMIEVEGEKARLRALQKMCKHPDLRQYSAMGELGDICDDCGYQT